MPSQKQTTDLTTAARIADSYRQGARLLRKMADEVDAKAAVIERLHGLVPVAVTP